MRADGTAGDGAVVLARRDVRAPHVGDDDDDGARIDVAFATRDDEADGDDDGATTRTSRGVVVSYATSARACASRRADARGRFEARALRVEGATGERTAWASGTRATGTRRLAAAFGREARVVTDDDEEAVVFEANVLAMCFTRGGAMACAMDDGRVATRSASGGDAGTRRAREGGAKRAIVSAEDGEDGACGAVAVCFDGESVVYVARAAVDEAVDALRHPARARATSWRGGTLATLCADGALRLWMRANGRTELTCTIQTPRGGLVPVVAFDWLETSETSDSLYDHAIIGADGASGIHVWTLSDVDAAHPLSARRPVVSHRGSMTFERAMDLTLADGVVIRGSLTQSDDDVRVLLASRRLGVVVARAARDRPNVLEKLYGVSLRGHATTIVDARVHPTTGVLTTKDASGVCRAWRRDARGEVEIADETTDADAAEAIECARMERCGSGASVAARAHVGGRDVEASSDGKRFAFVDDEGRRVVGAVAGDSKVILERVDATASVPRASAIFRWFDIGGGAHALATAMGTVLEVYAPSPSLYASKKTPWRRILRVDVAEFAGPTQSAISTLTWSLLGDVVYVAIDCVILTVGFEGDDSKCGVARRAIRESKNLPSYHPRVLIDWLKRGELDRARKSLRAVMKYLAANDFDSPCPSIPPSELWVMDDDVEDVTVASPAPTASTVDVPEFDMSAFGAFGGGAPAAATFSFGADFDQNAMTSTSPSTVSARRAGHGDAFTQREAEDATELLSSLADKLALAPAERVQLLGVIDALRNIERGIATLGSAVDEPGRRFAALWHTRRLRRVNDHEGPCGQELAWAAQCATTVELLDNVLDGSAVDSPNADWMTVKTLGVPIWLRDDGTLRSLIEECAKGEFARTKNADDCALLFVCVDRVKVLAGLYKATQNKPLYEFMCRDFSEQRHRDAALKNAYALLSKHRYSFAAAFFILGGQPLDAASLVWKHDRDLSLTLVIARLAAKKHVEGTHSTVGYLTSDVVSVLQNDIAPTMSDPWTLAALRWLAGDFKGFFSSMNSLMETYAVDATDLLVHIASSSREEDTVSNAKTLLRCSSATLLHSLEALGMPLAALERLQSCGQDSIEDACRLAVGSLLAGQKSSDVTDVALEVFTRKPWSLSSATMRSILHRRLDVERFEGFDANERTLKDLNTSTPVKSLHVKTPSVLPTEIHTVSIPRVPSGQDLTISGSPTEKVAKARNAFSKLRRLSVKAKRQKNFGIGESAGDDSPTTPRSPEFDSGTRQVGNDDASAKARVLRTPVDVASLQNDGFYDICFNHEVPYELGCASVRQGLSVVNLRKLNENDNESHKDAWAVLLQAQPPISGFKSSMNSWLHVEDVASTPASPRGGHGREHEWATHAGLDMTSLTGIIPQSQSESVGRSRAAITREPANDVVARSVAAHPSRSFFAVGTSMGGVQLWDFHGENADRSAAVLSLGGKKSTSGTGASMRSLAWSPHGARLAACASDGNVTLWLGDAPDVEPAASKMCGFKGSKTEDVLFLSTNVMAVASSTGSSLQRAPECVTLWDALQPFHASPGVIRTHSGGCTSLSQFPSLVAPHGVPWPFLITGGYNGDVAAHDLRMLGGDAESTVLWRSFPPQTSTITSIAAIHHETTPLVVIADQSGDLLARSALDGAELQRVKSAHAPQKFLTPRGGGAFASLGASKIIPIHAGILSAGGDGIVRCFRLDKSRVA